MLVPVAVPIEIHDDPVIELDPGPARVRFELRDLATDQSREFPITVPDDGTVTLKDLLEQAFDWTPEQLSEFARLRTEAVDAAARAEQAADNLDEAVESAKGYRDESEGFRDTAVTKAGEANDSAAAALAHSTEAGVQRWEAVNERWAATDARNLAIGAKDDAIDARDAAEGHAGDAETHATAAAGSATAASGSASAAAGSAQTAEQKAIQTAADALTLQQRIEAGAYEIGYTPDDEPYLLPPADVLNQNLTVDTSVGTRVMLGGVMIFGDTGWRTISAPPGWTTDTGAGRCAVRRIGNRVEFEARLAPAGDNLGQPRSSVGTHLIAGIVPGNGFLTDFRGMCGTAFSNQGAMLGAIRMQGALDARLYWANPITGNWGSSDWITFQMGWFTSNPWPTSLPGVPA
ncbi:MAG: hypothetical protein ACK4UY_03820 [Dietzia sp.]